VKAFLSIKFWGDDRNRREVEGIIAAIEDTGAEVYCFRRDGEKWGETEFKPSEMMDITLGQIDKSDILVADVGDWPIGVGVEAGYARGRGIPVVCICPAGKKVASTVAGLADEVVIYNDYEDLNGQLSSIFVR
jgi:nucleoside 2-deoxyribosyltransferase